jgi:hypothetical protein
MMSRSAMQHKYIRDHVLAQLHFMLHCTAGCIESKQKFSAKNPCCMPLWSSAELDDVHIIPCYEEQKSAHSTSVYTCKGMNDTTELSTPVQHVTYIAAANVQIIFFSAREPQNFEGSVPLALQVFS